MVLPWLFNKLQKQIGLITIWWWTRKHKYWNEKKECSVILLLIYKVAWSHSMAKHLSWLTLYQEEQTNRVKWCEIWILTWLNMAPFSKLLIFFQNKCILIAGSHSKAHSLQWGHNGRDSVSNQQPHDCLLNCLFRRRSKKTSKLRVIGLCVGNSPHKWPVTRKMFPFHDVIMSSYSTDRTINRSYHCAKPSIFVTIIVWMLSSKGICAISNDHCGVFNISDGSLKSSQEKECVKKCWWISLI